MEKEPGEISVIFTSNDYLLEINRKYLKHSYYTDVITFNYNMDISVSGDIFVSIEQVKINAGEIGTDFYEELSRVIIHGVLHLLEFDDIQEKDRAEMRKQENIALKELEELRNGKSI